MSWINVGDNGAGDSDGDDYDNDDIGFCTYSKAYSFKEFF